MMIAYSPTGKKMHQWHVTLGAMPGRTGSYAEVSSQRSAAANTSGPAPAGNAHKIRSGASWGISHPGGTAPISVVAASVREIPTRSSSVRSCASYSSSVMRSMAVAAQREA